MVPHEVYWLIGSVPEQKNKLNKIEVDNFARVLLYGSKTFANILKLEFSFHNFPRLTEFSLRMGLHQKSRSKKSEP